MGHLQMAMYYGTHDLTLNTCKLYHEEAVYVTIIILQYSNQMEAKIA